MLEFLCVCSYFHALYRVCVRWIFFLRAFFWRLWVAKVAVKWLIKKKKMNGFVDIGFEHVSTCSPSLIYEFLITTGRCVR